MGLLALIAVLTGVALIAAVRWEHSSDMILPKPTGPFPVGRSTFSWTNEALTDPRAWTTGSKREVFVWLWYPASPAAGVASAPYLPQPLLKAQADATGTLMREYLNHDFARVRTNSVLDAPVSTARASYPVVIMRPGSGALTSELTTLAEDLASYGYVVAGFDAPYRTGVFVFPDGNVVTRATANNPETMNYEAGKQLANRLLPIWTSDAAFVVDQLGRLNTTVGNSSKSRFSGKLDLSRLGVFGHSFGGAQALQFCHDDARCKAAMDIDGMPFGSVIREGESQPSLLLFSDHSREASSEEGRQIRNDIVSLYDHLRGPRHVVMIRGANHFTFTDQMVTKDRLFILAFTFFMRSPGALRGLEITRAYVHTFFDAYLKDGAVGALTKLAATYDEIQPFDAMPVESH